MFKHVDGVSYARDNTVDKIDIRKEEFDYIVSAVMRLPLHPMNASIRAAYLVLFLGKTQKEASEITGSSKGNISTTLTRIRTQHEALRNAYGSRFVAQEPKMPPQSERIINILKRFNALGITEIDKMMQILEMSTELDLERLLDVMELARSA